MQEDDDEPDYNYTLDLGARERTSVDTSRRRPNVVGRRAPSARDTTSLAEDPSDTESTGLLDEGRQNV